LNKFNERATQWQSELHLFEILVFTGWITIVPPVDG